MIKNTERVLEVLTNFGSLLTSCFLKLVFSHLVNFLSFFAFSVICFKHQENATFVEKLTRAAIFFEFIHFATIFSGTLQVFSLQFRDLWYIAVGGLVNLCLMILLGFKCGIKPLIEMISLHIVLTFLCIFNASTFS